MQQRQFSSRATCMGMLPVSVDAQQRTAVLGFADGSVRLLRLCADGWRLLAAVKPHKVWWDRTPAWFQHVLLGRTAASGSICTTTSLMIVIV
jgi:hypothetical protein